MISLAGLLACMLTGSLIGSHLRSAKMVLYGIAGLLAIIQTGIVLYDLYSMPIPEPLM